MLKLLLFGWRHLCILPNARVSHTETPEMVILQPNGHCQLKEACEGTGACRFDRFEGIAG